MKKNMMRLMLAMLLSAIVTISAAAQITTSEIVGVVTDQNGAAVVGATVTVVHEPTGSKSSSVTNDDGRYNLPGLRVGGPYTITVTAPGFKQQESQNVTTSVGNTSNINFALSVAEANAVVTVTSDTTFSEERTGASTSISNDVINTLPTTGRRINDFAKLSPFYGGGPFGGSIAGQDNRMNNITVDGSYFNNSFGLSGQPGERTNVSPISLEAIQEFQVNVAPYDVRQGNFVGAGINTVTKSGTNTYHGSAYYDFRNETFGGTKTGNLLFNRGQLDYKLWGFTIGGPLPYLRFGEGSPSHAVASGKDKAFFFFSYENEKTSKPAHTFTACNTGQTCQSGSVSKVKASDLDTFSAFLQSKFGYDTGAYQGYNFSIPATKFLFRNDWNINSGNRFTFRYLRLRSTTDNPISTSNSGGTAGFGRGSNGLSFLSFQNSGYKIQENIDSYVGEWTSTFSPHVANSLIVGYTLQDESRPNTTKLFPLIDIHDGSASLSASTTLTSAGYEPFTPLNTLQYHSFQIQDNLSWYRGRHTYQTGMSFEQYHSLNIFFPSSQSIYSYRSFTDFYADANAFLNGTPSTVNPARFNVRYNNIPGSTIPIQPLDVKYVGVYGQDQWKIRENLNITYGLRVEVPFFGATGFANPLVDTLTFRNGDGSPLKLSTSKLPGRNVLYSPRLGFNYSPLRSAKLQFRGGTGVFSARPPYVWISNQIGNNGVLTNITNLDSTTGQAPGTFPYHFNPNPDAYKPASVTGAPVAGAQDLNFTVPNYKFPAIWRSSFAVDYQLPFNLIAGAEYLYSRDVNGTAYINANLSAPDGAFVGADNRPRWIADTCPGTGLNAGQQVKVNCAVVQAITLENSNVGRASNIAFTLEKRSSHGVWIKGGYAYGVSKNLVDASSTAGTSFGAIFTRGNPNAPELSYSSATMGHRVYAAASYHIDYFHFGGTTISAFWESKTQSTNSYRYSNDMNGDGTQNDMIYIQKDPSETLFVANGAFTPAQESAAWEAYINQDKYLSSHRGQYALRGAVFYPLRHQLDMSFSQDFHVKFLGAEQHLQLRADILNFGNLLNHNWGGAVTPANNNFNPLAFVGIDATTSRPTFRLNTFSSQLITSTFTRRVTGADVYTYQLGLRYSF